MSSARASALFAPLPKLGLIAVDEEQDTSFKNLAAPFYHARDAAIKRAQIERIPVVLGSATPALETWHNAQTLEHYQLLRLDERVAGAKLPAVKLVDTTRPELGQQTTVLSEELRRRLTETLARRAAGDSAPQPPRVFRRSALRRVSYRRELSALHGADGLPPVGRYGALPSLRRT